MFSFSASLCVVNGIKITNLGGIFKYRSLKKLKLRFPQQLQLNFPLDVFISITIYGVNCYALWDLYTQSKPCIFI